MSNRTCWKLMEIKGEGIHKEVKYPICHQLLHIFVRLPLLGCFEHIN